MGPAKLLFFWSIAILAAYTDFHSRRVPNLLVLAGLAGGAVWAACGGWPSLLAAASGLLLGFLFLLPAFLLGGVGGGDVKSLALIGLFTGPSLLVTSFLCGAAAGGVVALVVILLRRLSTRRSPAGAQGRMRPLTLPYAGILFLAAATVITFLPGHGPST